MQEIYEPLNHSLQQVGALMSAAEAHGLLCGLSYTSQVVKDELWLKYVLTQTAVEDGLASQCEQQLLLLKNYTLKQLNSPYCEFTPLLPEDDISLLERTQALGGWCEGFLFGLGVTGIETESLSEDGREFIEDIISISRITSAHSNDENNEENYMQVVEYIRIGILNLFEELHFIQN